MSQQSSGNPNRVDSHPAKLEADKLREKNQRVAHRFIIRLWIGLGLTVLSYILLHIIFLPRDTLWPPDDLLEIDSSGRLIRLSEPDLRWYLGREQAAAIVSLLKERTQRINDLQDRVVRQSLLEFEVRFSSAGDLSKTGRDRIRQLAYAAHNGSFDRASELLTDMINGWMDQTRKQAGEKSIFDLNYGLSELARLKQQQKETLGKVLQPPLMHQIFWMSPLGALAEGAFFSFLGTLVNLIVNMSKARTRGNFRSDEVWISASKLIYGPVVSAILILAIYFGLLNAGAELRFWLLPLVGFIFGYNTRKTIVLLDRFSQKVLGAADKSAREIDQVHAQAASLAAAAIRANERPKTFTELKNRVPELVDITTSAAVLKQQSSK